MGLRKVSRTSSKSKSKAALVMNFDEDVDDDSVGSQENTAFEVSEDNEVEESSEQKRRRLARTYLEYMRTDEADGDHEDDPKDTISEKLIRERLGRQGKLFRSYAHKFQSHSFEPVILKGHKASVTAVAVSSDSLTAYSGSKDNSILKWDIETHAMTVLKAPWSKVDAYQSHDSEVLAVALSTDGKYLVSGGRDCRIRVFDCRINAEVKVFQGHRGAVTSLAFKKDSSILFSAGEDRCIKQWDLDEMGYLETLFGHQESINALDCWTKDQPLSGSSDRTTRLFKVASGSHLVFRSHRSSVEAVGQLTEDSFVTGGQDGGICLWKEAAKKPVCSVTAAHGLDGFSPRWITSLATFKMTDTVISGSYDGFVKIWQGNTATQSLQPTSQIAVEGFVNSLAVSSKLLVVGTGSEHRLGRWWKLKGNHNVVQLFKLPA